MVRGDVASVYVN